VDLLVNWQKRKKKWHSNADHTRKRKGKGLRVEDRERSCTVVPQPTTKRALELRQESLAFIPLHPLATMDDSGGVMNLD
jgi:hypothetical protein